jgi:hypothetical protein
MTQRILEATTPGDEVVAPQSLSITLAITSTDVWTVAPLRYYLGTLRHEPGFHWRQRRTLSDFVNDLGDRHRAAVRSALRGLQVDVACVGVGDGPGYRDLRRFGFAPLARSVDYRCLQRS